MFISNVRFPTFTLIKFSANAYPCNNVGDCFRKTCPRGSGLHCIDRMCTCLNYGGDCFSFAIKMIETTRLGRFKKIHVR